MKYALVRVANNDSVDYVLISEDYDKLHDIMKKEYREEYVKAPEWMDREEMAFACNITPYVAYVGDHDEVIVYWQIVPVKDFDNDQEAKI